MALKHFVRIEGKGIDQHDLVGYWELQAGDTAQPIVVPRYSDKSVQLHGVWGGGATVTLQQSNDADLTTYATAYDPRDNEITGTADTEVFAILPNSYLLKPIITGGNGSTLVRVSIAAHGE